MTSGRRTSHAGPSTPSASTAIRDRRAATLDALGASLDLDRHHVGVPDEPRDERRRRSPIDLVRLTDLLDTALVEDDDAVRERQRLTLVVGHVHERAPVSRCTRRSSTSISRRIFRSSADSGSSSRSTFGRFTNARASATRCICPPDSS